MHILQVITTWFILVIIPHNSVYGFGYNLEDLPLGKCKLNLKKGPSPVDINTSRAIPLLPQCQDFQFDYNDSLAIDTIENDGHSVVLTANKNKARPCISGGALPASYEFDNLHFHWSEHSEHTINKKSYPLEVHLVHFNKAYSNVSEATNYDNGVAVVASFFELQRKDNKCLEPLAEELLLLQKPTIRKTNMKLSVECIMPLNTISKPGIYVYGGSLTTGNYEQVVNWIVFERPIPISLRQLNRFQSLLDHNDKIITNNSRDVQPLCDRKIYKGNCILKNMKKKMLVKMQDPKQTILKAMKFPSLFRP